MNKYIFAYAHNIVVYLILFWEFSTIKDGCFEKIKCPLLNAFHLLKGLSSSFFCVILNMYKGSKTKKILRSLHMVKLLARGFTLHFQNDDFFLLMQLSLNFD
jgi:hypothetical protein